MQKRVNDFNLSKGCHTKQMPVYARIMDIQSELGELAKEYLKQSKYGTQEFELTNEFKMEYGDVLYSLLSLANELNIDAKQSVDFVLEKYSNRIKKNNNMGSGN